MISIPKNDDPRVAPDMSCRSFGVGHQVHLIQARKAAHDNDNRYLDATILGIDIDGWFDLDINSETVRRWTHSPERLAYLADRYPTVSVNLRWSMLKVGPKNPFSISADPTPCVYEEPTGTLAEQLETHGGFLVPGTQALEELRAQHDDG